MKSWWNMRETHIDMLKIEYQFVALDEFVLCIVYNNVEIWITHKGYSTFLQICLFFAPFSFNQ
jgi:hypothetical protein